MTPEEVTATVAALVDIDPEAATGREALAELVDTSRRVRGWLDAFDVRCTRRARELAHQGRSESPEALHSGTGGRSTKDSATLTDRELVCTAATTFEAALAAGAVTSGHVDAVARAVRGLDEDLAARFWDQEASLLAIARHADVDAFTRRVRDVVRRLRAAVASSGSDADELDAQRRQSSVRRWIDKVTGMHHTHLELDPVRDAEMWTAVNAQLSRLRQADGNGDQPFEQLRVDAVVSAVSAVSAVPADSTTGSGRRVPQIVVLVDLDSLTSGLHDAGVCETSEGVPLPVATVRRMCCDAEVLPVVLDGSGHALDVGRSRRTATAAQRHALRAMHRSCAHPGCGVPFDDCRIHHVRWWWEHAGRSDLDNLIPLCERHHHLVHEGGWKLAMTPERVTTWSRPDGVVAFRRTSTDRAPTGVTASRRRAAVAAPG